MVNEREKNYWEILSGGHLKLIGAAMMVFDHLRQMFSAYGAPEWFYWVGRPVAPLFAFLCAEGFAHTRAPGKYMFRLLAGFEFMNAVSILISRALPNNDVVLSNNIFETFLLAVVYMWLADRLRRDIAEKAHGRAAFSALLMFLIAAAGLFAFALLTNPAAMPNTPLWLKILLLRSVPNIFAAEGGPVFILMTVLFYLFRKERWQQALTLVLTGSLVFYMGSGAQWLMVLAALFMFLYNGERGNVGKYFFYIFYPAHIYIFYIIACLGK